MSFPRAGRICSVQILADLGSLRERFDSVKRQAAEAGVAPVTYQSLTCIADNSRHASAWTGHV